MIKVAIAGYGILGKVRRAVIDDMSDVKVVAISDKVINNIDNTNGIAVYDNYIDMLKDKSISFDAVFVCLTNDVNPHATIMSLEREAHVFCEKPPGRKVSDIENVRLVENRSVGKKLMYGFNHRYHDSIQDALKIINSNELGNIINIRGVYGKAKLVTFAQDNWRTNRDVSGGGVLLDQGIHMVDLMRLFCGDFVEVHSFISNNYWNHNVEDNAYVLMKTDNDIVGILHSSATQWRHKFSIDINLEYGNINLGGILTGSRSYGSETMTIVSADPDQDFGDPKEYTTRYNKDLSWQSEMDIFFKSIVDNTDIKDGNSLDALKTMELVYEIYKADKEWSEKYDIT